MQIAFMSIAANGKNERKMAMCIILRSDGILCEKIYENVRENLNPGSRI
jgi:hypothetical protein